MVPPKRLSRTESNGMETEPKLKLAMTQTKSTELSTMNGIVFCVLFANYSKGLKKKGSYSVSRFG